MPVTIKDVARESQVSAATVSYVLNDGPRPVHAETRARVLAAMQRLGYHPSTVARGLARKQMDCIGVVLPHPEASLAVDPYFSGILDGVIRVATARRQNVTLYTGLEWQGASQSLPAFRDRRVDGLLLLATRADSDIVPALTEADIPFVLVSGTVPDARVSCVDIDNVGAARHAVAHLLDLGHWRIALLGGPPNSPSTPARREGYREALLSRGLVPDEALVLNGSYDKEWGHTGMARLLSLPEPPTAVFAGSDMIALGAYGACAEAGVAIPEQMSIVGFDDTTLASHLSPTLTTVRQPLGQIGAAAATLLLDRLQRPCRDTPPPARILVPTELIVRASAGRPRREGPARSQESGTFRFVTLS